AALFVLSMYRRPPGSPLFPYTTLFRSVRDRTGFSYLGATDARGLFVVLTRLGDESVGEALTVRQGTTERRIAVAFDPTNHADERGTRVHFEGARAVEHAAWFRSTLLNVVGVTTRHGPISGGMPWPPRAAPRA